MQIQAVIFDRDNTLMHFELSLVAELETRIAAIAPELAPGVALRHWNTWPGPWPRQAAEEPVFWRNFWSSLASEYHLTPDQLHTLSTEIGSVYHTCFAAYPDVVPALASLRKAGLRLAVLTNFELPSVDRTLLHAGIDPDLFEVTLSSSVLGVAKPDPAAYQAAAAALNLSPDACAFIDDLPENVAAARSIGMQGILLDRNLPADNLAAATICSLDALTRMLLPPTLLD